MHYDLTTLPNGLRIITEEMPSLRSVALDVASVKVYEVLYVHKICRSGMTLVRNG